jgi:zinc transporter, ZIP family
MGEAFGWGAFGASALLIGAFIAYQFAPSRSVIAVVMALGTGLLIGSVSFELIDEALKTQTVAWVALLVLVGAAAFTVGNWLLERHGGSKRKDPSGRKRTGRQWRSCSGRCWTASPSRSYSASPSSRAG